MVNAHPEVAHNYEREHALNMWFVLATERPSEIDARSPKHRGRDRARGPATCPSSRSSSSS